MFPSGAQSSRLFSLGCGGGGPQNGALTLRGPSMMFQRCLWSALAGILLSAAGAVAAECPGLYFRADLGVGYAESAAFTFPAVTNGNPVYTANGSTNGEATPFGSLGLGYSTGFGLRTDVSLAYLSSTIAGTAPGGSASNPYTLSSTRAEALVGLINGYIDLAHFFPRTFDRIQPYVGGGIGAARIDVGPAIGPTYSCCGPYAFRTPGARQTNRAWDLAAGLTLPVNDGLSVDLMYSYLNLGQVHGGTAAQFAAESFFTGPLTTKLDVQRLSLGVRVAF